MSQFPEQYLIDVEPPADPWDSFVKPDEWKASILQTLTKIATSDAGMVLLRSMRSSGRWILVQPTLAGECNAHGAGAAAFARSKRFYMGIVKFDPQSYLKGSLCYDMKNRAGNSRGFRPDEVLFHELIHAHRGALRLSLNPADGSALAGGLIRYSHAEEFIAIVVTNVYISDETNRVRSGLRRDHRGGLPLEACLNTSLTFFRSSPQVLPLLKKFAAQQPLVFNQLAEVKADFNPFYAMIHHPQKVEALSNSKFARDRETTVPKQPTIRPPAPAPPTLLDAFKGLGGELAKQALQVLSR